MYVIVEFNLCSKWNWNYLGETYIAFQVLSVAQSPSKLQFHVSNDLFPMNSNDPLNQSHSTFKLFKKSHPVWANVILLHQLVFIPSACLLSKFTRMNISLLSGLYLL